MFGKASVVLVSLVLVLTIAPAGAPVQVSYVYSDSMEPTLETNDGFLLIPTASTDVGDVVTFRSSNRDGYVTHRIVGRSESGFITKGDNNRATDQSAGYDPVTKEEIVGTVLTFEGKPVTVPEYGTAVTTLREYDHLLLLGVGALLLVQTLTTRTARPSRTVVRVGDVLLPLFVACVLSAVAIMYLGAAVHQLTFVAVAVPSDAPNTLTVGEPKTMELIVNRSQSPLTRSVTDVEGMRILSETRNDSHVVLTVRVPPPTETGRYTARLTRRQYPAIVPISVVRQSNRIHPILSVTLTALFVLAPLYVCSRLLVDGATPIRPPRQRWRRRLDEVWR